MRDMNNNFDAVNSIDPDDYVADVNGAGIDLRAFDGSAVVFSVGTVDDGTHTPMIQESDDNSNWNDVNVSDEESSLVDLSSDMNQLVGYKRNKRYLRSVLTIAGATTGAQLAALVVLGIPHHAPAI